MELCTCKRFSVVDVHSQVGASRIVDLHYTIPACTRSGPSLRPDTPRLCLWDSVPRDSVDPIYFP